MIPRLKFLHALFLWTIFGWSALAILISVWSESAIAFVPVAKISNPPATINIVVNNLPYYIETGCLRAKLVDCRDGKADLLPWMNHLRSVKQFRNSMFVSRIMNVEAAFAANLHAMGWGMPIVPDHNFQLIRAHNAGRSSRDLGRVAFINKENIIRGDVGTQFLSSSFFGTFDQASGSPPQSDSSDKQQTREASHRVCPEFMPPILIWLFFAAICLVCINWTAGLGDDALRYGFRFRSWIWYGLCGLSWLGTFYLLFLDGICSLWSLF